MFAGNHPRNMTESPSIPEGNHPRYPQDIHAERGFIVLVLRRKSGQAIVMNGVISVRVLAVEGEVVKLGFDAPPDVIIVREELLDDARNAPQLVAPIGGNPDE